MKPTIEKISAVTLRVANMTESVRFYRDVLSMELLYVGEYTLEHGPESIRIKRHRGFRASGDGGADLDFPTLSLQTII
jgi:catechol 2,3-dioxygenase-like lactoylglutathione lyase family enzyme